MNRIIGATLSVVVVLIFSASLSGGTVAGSDIMKRSSGCRTAPAFLSAAENVFLTSSASTVSAAATFEGCWSYWPSGPCRAIFRNGNNYQICGQCDSYGNPGSGSCSSISSRTLSYGYWCS